MSEPVKICYLPDNEGTLVAVLDDLRISSSGENVFRYPLNSFPLIHGGSHPDGPLVGDYCGGKMRFSRVSEQKHVLACDICNLRQEVPNSAICFVDLPNL